MPCILFWFSRELPGQDWCHLPHRFVRVYYPRRKFQTAPTSFTMWRSRPSFRTNLSKSHTAEWIIFAVIGISVCSPLFETPFATVVLDGFLLLIKGSSSTNWLPCPSFFLDLVWQTMLPASFQQETMVLCMTVVPLASSLLSNSMKHCSQVSSNRVKNTNTGNQWNTALKEAAIVSKMRTPPITLWFSKHRF